MTKKVFSFPLLFGSLIGAMLGGGIIAIFMVGGVGDSAIACMVWTGIFFLFVYLGGLLGMRVAMALPLKYEIKKSGSVLLTVAAAVLIAAGGAGGQALFALEKETEVVTADPSMVDMVLLLDASGSMDTNGYSDNRTDAATQFVQSLTSDTGLAAVSFATTVLDSTGLIAMDSAGQTTLTDFIGAIDSVGGTNFDDALEEAADILKNEARSDSVKAVMLLTDGEGSVSESIKSNYISDGILLFTIRITGNASDSKGKALAAFANDTGGADVVLAPTGGSIDTSDMLSAFQDAFEAAAESNTSISLGEQLLVSESGITVWQLAVRYLTLALCTIFCSLGYFGRLSMRTLGADLLTALLSVVLVTTFHGIWYLIIAAFMGTALVRLQVEIPPLETDERGMIDV